MEIEKLVKQNVDNYYKITNNYGFEWDQRDEYFYRNRDGSFFPYLKSDIKSYINDLYPKSVIKILKMMDYPYFEEEYLYLVKMAIKNTINKKAYCSPFGKYLSKMKIKSFQNYTFKDSIYNKNIEYYDINIILKGVNKIDNEI